jgi:excinuclease ABC subunit C
MPLKRTFINSDQKKILEELSGLKIFVKNKFEQNQKELYDLMELGKQNSFIYLQRNKLGQKLSIFEENNLFISIVDLQKKLNLKKLPRRIECYDISHLQGKFVYGSMVTFVDGRAFKKFYRLFKCPDQNDDYKNHSEILTRRIKRFIDAQKENSENNNWKLPDLIIVDGGKGQLTSDYKVLENFGLINKVEICSLAKKVEEVFLPFKKESILLDGQTKFLIQRIRDEAHRFGITNNRKARLKTISKSQLDEIVGIGPKTKQKLLQTFTSISQIIDNLYKNPELIDELVGKKITEKLKNFFLGNLRGVDK